MTHAFLIPIGTWDVCTLGTVPDRRVQFFRADTADSIFARIFPLNQGGLTNGPVVTIKGKNILVEDPLELRNRKVDRQFPLALFGEKKQNDIIETLNNKSRRIEVDNLKSTTASLVIR